MRHTFGGATPELRRARLRHIVAQKRTKVTMKRAISLERARPRVESFLPAEYTLFLSHAQRHRHPRSWRERRNPAATFRERFRASYARRALRQRVSARSSARLYIYFHGAADKPRATSSFINKYELSRVSRSIVFVDVHKKRDPASSSTTTWTTSGAQSARKYPNILPRRHASAIDCFPG